MANNFFSGANSSPTTNFFDVSQSVIQDLRYIPQYESKPSANAFPVGTLVYDLAEGKFYEATASGWSPFVLTIDFADEISCNTLNATTVNFTTASGTTVIADLVSASSVSATTVAAGLVDATSVEANTVSASSIYATAGTIVTLSSTTVNATTVNATTVSASSVFASSGSIDALTVDSVQFDTSAAVDVTVGQVAWNDTDETLDVGINSSVTLQVGQESLLRARNDTSGDIPNGTVVYVSGALGNRPTIAPACANNGAPCTGKVIGVTTQLIPINGDGFVTTEGLVRGLDTTEDFASVSLSAGDVLYLSTTPGEWVKTPPASPAREVRVGYVTRISPSVGTIFVSIDNGRTLEELHDVNIVSVFDGDVLIYDASASIWQHVAQSGIDAGTLNGQSGSYYLDWTNTTNKPDPTITLSNDASGSVTLTDLASGTLSVSNVNATTLNSQSANYYLEWTNVIDKPDPTITLGGDASGSVTLTDLASGTLSVSNVNATTLASQSAAYYLDWANVTDKPDPTITFSGDVSGSVTLTDVTSASVTITVLDDSHNHIISNVDGLQTALDGKVDENVAITGGTFTKITYDTKGLVTSGSNISASDVPNLDATKITSGVFDDARISSSSVIQHEAALTITESQVSDLDKYDQSVVDAKDAAVEASAVAFAIALG